MEHSAQHSAASNGRCCEIVEPAVLSATSPAGSHGQLLVWALALKRAAEHVAEGSAAQRSCIRHAVLSRGARYLIPDTTIYRKRTPPAGAGPLPCEPPAGHCQLPAASPRNCGFSGWDTCPAQRTSDGRRWSSGQPRRGPADRGPPPDFHGIIHVADALANPFAIRARLRPATGPVPFRAPGRWHRSGHYSSVASLAEAADYPRAIRCRGRR